MSVAVANSDCNVNLLKCKTSSELSATLPMDVSDKIYHLWKEKAHKNNKTMFFKKFSKVSVSECVCVIYAQSDDKFYKPTNESTFPNQHHHSIQQPQNEK